MFILIDMALNRKKRFFNPFTKNAGASRWGTFFEKKRQEKKKSMDPIIFAFYIADDLIS
jgi:hypothetical protein